MMGKEGYNGGTMPPAGGPSALDIDVIGRPLTPVSAAGMHTVKKVSRYEPEGLQTRFVEINKETRILKGQPALVVIAYWVRQSRTPSRIVEY
jgi:hypothetical protein